MAGSYTIKHNPEFSQLVAALSEQAQAELAAVYRALARGPLPGQSLLAVEPYSAVPNTYTVPFRGGLLIYVIPPGKRIDGRGRAVVAVPPAPAGVCLLPTPVSPSLSWPTTAASTGTWLPNGHRTWLAR